MRRISRVWRRRRIRERVKTTGGLEGPHYSPAPALSAIVVFGDRRDRAYRSLAHLLAQTVLDQMEIVVVDLGDDDRWRDVHPVRRFHRPDLESVGQARAEGARQARGRILAFVEDHSYAEPTWAAEVIEAFNRPVHVVNYAVKPADPGSLLARMFVLIEYGRWMHPAVEGPVSLSACHNVAYRRDVLEPFWNQLDRELDAEFLMCRRMQRHGATIWLASRARVEHESWTQIAMGIEANGTLRKLFAAERARQGQWTVVQRTAWAGGMVLTPLLHIGRLARSLIRRPALWALFWVTLPLMALVYTAGSIAEAAGYLFGAGGSRARFRDLEISTERQV
jgi:hypothetical protein